MEGSKSDVEVVLKYHRDSCICGNHKETPLSLDQTPMPSPFRKFLGVRTIPLPKSIAVSEKKYCDLFKEPQDVQSLSKKTLSQFLFYSNGITAVKIAGLQEGGEMYTLRANPSSGGLHPTEIHLITPPNVLDSSKASVVHYAAAEHALELRQEIDCDFWSKLGLPSHAVFLCASSVHWREVWKYKQRGLRYGLIDAGHAAGSVVISARLLGWECNVIPLDNNNMKELFGLKDSAFESPEELDDPQFVIMLAPRGTPVDIPTISLRLHHLQTHVAGLEWSGTALKLSDSHSSILSQVLTVTAKTESVKKGAQQGIPNSTATEPLFVSSSNLNAVDVITKRRSARNFDPVHSFLDQKTFYTMLASTVPKLQPSFWNNLESLQPTSVWLCIFVHRVRGLQRGIYLLMRQSVPSNASFEKAQILQNSLHLPHVGCSKIPIEKPPNCPDQLPLFQIASGNVAKYAGKISVSQSLCGNGSFMVAMFGDLEKLSTHGSHFYRKLHWEAGLIGHLLYLESTAAGMGATGVGAFFDDAVNTLFTRSSAATYYSLYHFAVGKPEIDERIMVETRISLSSQCANCGKGNCTAKCSRCKSQVYCSKKCQTDHWKKEHKKTCGKTLDALQLLERHNSPVLPIETKLGLFKQNAKKMNAETLFRFNSFYPLNKMEMTNRAVSKSFFEQTSMDLAESSRRQLVIVYLQGMEFKLLADKEQDPALKWLLNYHAVSLYTMSLADNGYWTAYCGRAMALYNMREYNLAFQDCVKARSAVYTGYTRTPPPNQYEASILEEEILQIQNECASKIHIDGRISLVSIDLEHMDELYDMFAGESLEDWKLEQDSACGPDSVVDPRALLEILDMNQDPTKIDVNFFLETVDRIPFIRSTNTQRTTQRVWSRFPQAIKQDYLTYSSHPTDMSDPRFVSFVDTLLWLERDYLCNEKFPEITLEFVCEVNRRVTLHDNESRNYEDVKWGQKLDFGTTTPGEMRSFYSSLGYAKDVSKNFILNNLSPQERQISKSLKTRREDMRVFDLEDFSATEHEVMKKIVHVTAPPTEAKELLQTLLDSYTTRSQHPIQQAAILGMGLVSIHPFANGNGRTQLIIMNLVLMKHGYPPIFRRDHYQFMKNLDISILFEKEVPSADAFTCWLCVNVAMMMLHPLMSLEECQRAMCSLFNRHYSNQSFQEHWSVNPLAKNNSNLLADENLESFLQRCVPTSNMDNWITVHSQKASPAPHVNTDALPRKDVWTEEEIDQIAKRHNSLTGKWTIQVAENEVDGLWCKVAREVANDRITAFASKVSTAANYNCPPHFHNHYVICVYTKNYMDEKEVFSVLHQLRQLGVKGCLKYKPDIYTYLEIYSYKNDSISEWRYIAQE